ncbi:hypothetical protein BROUX41_000644 [Berkeleyomyces rouxiae]|uniref:uncharacterized protein n=1 Tax=Berkeleyomyces rouxiae TaxID=2035830 RepID=UPI003B81AEE8
MKLSTITAVLSTAVGFAAATTYCPIEYFGLGHPATSTTKGIVPAATNEPLDCEVNPEDERLRVHLVCVHQGEYYICTDSDISTSELENENRRQSGETNHEPEGADEISLDEVIIFKHNNCVFIMGEWGCLVGILKDDGETSTITAAPSTTFSTSRITARSAAPK